MDKVLTTPELNGERIKRYLKEGKRFDGRKPDEFRKVEIEFGVSNKAEGSARVKLGKTEVIAGVKLDVGTPYPDSMNKGNLIVSAELLPLSSPRFEAGPPKFETIELGRVIDRGLRESGFIDFEGLCIKEGEKVWTVYVDIYSINDDGNLLDAAGIAAIAALRIAKMPGYNEETGKADYENSTDKPVPLTEINPIPITVRKIGDGLLVDPTREEEDLGEARITVGSYKGRISSIQKGEFRSMTIDEIYRAFDMVEKACDDVNKAIEKALKA